MENRNGQNTACHTQPFSFAADNSIWSNRGRRDAVYLLRFLFAAMLIAAAGLMLPLPKAYAATNPTGRGIGYTAELYDNTNGLPTSDANVILQTEEGFIWIGSYSGLIRYDGNEFYRYDSSTGVTSVVSLFADSGGQLWIGTNDSGVYVLKDEEFASYDREEGLRSSSIRSILEDEDGNILIATTMGMAYVDPEGVMHFLDEPQINTEYVCELVRGEDGIIYGVTLGGAFFTLEHLRLTGFYDSETLGIGFINTVYPDPEREGYIYIGTQDGKVVHGDPAKGMQDSKVIDMKPQKMVRCLRQIQDGIIWVCADTGIGYLKDGRYTHLPELPMTDSVEHVIEDYEGNLWFTSSRQGVMKIVRNRFHDISGMAGLPPAVVNTTCLKGGLLYIGTDRGLIILNGAYETVENELTEMMDEVRIRAIEEDSSGKLWISTYSDYGLVRYDPAEGTIVSYNTDNGLASDRARAIREMSDGKVVVATNSGVNIIEDGKVIEQYDNGRGISNLQILCLEEGPSGEIYAGSDGDGLYVIGGGKVRRIGLDDGLRSEVILRIRRDIEEEGLYWIVTSNSIAYMREEKVTPVQHFPYSNNFDIFFDSRGLAWVLSSNGIYVVKRADLFRDKKIDYTLYDTKSGLPCAPTANAFSDLTEDGMLYIAASNGVSAVDINDDSDWNGEVRLAVPYVMADGKYIAIKDGKVRIPAGCRRLTIFAYAFTYSLNNPHLKYKLRGFDETEVELTQHEMKPVSYTNLAGGTYNFHFSMLNPMTEEEQKGLEIAIIKKKSIFEEAWYWILIAMAGAFAIVMGVWTYYRNKTNVLLVKQEENRRLISQMSSVFASCIDMKDPYTNGHSHRVAKYSALLAERLGKDKEYVEKIHHIALLHDIGKIAIPDSILNKPSRLTDEEFEIVKSHPQKGYDILKEVDIAPDLAVGAGYHHERLDGLGYPNGFKDAQIPEIAQIIAVADTFDAMYSTRPYRRQMPIEEVAGELERGAGTQLNERAVRAMLELIREGAFDSAKEPESSFADAKEPEGGKSETACI